MNHPGGNSLRTGAGVLGRPLPLQTPADVRLTLVFRLADVTSVPPAPPAPGFSLPFVGAWADLSGVRGLLLRQWGPRVAVKAFAKVATGKRKLALAVCDSSRSIAAYAWFNIGFSHRYPVGPRDVVIGPMETYPAFRRRGLASSLLALGCERLMRTRHRVFYLDTREDNAGMIKASLAVGFHLVAAHWMFPDSNPAVA